MTYKMPNFQIKMTENGELSPIGGAIIIPTIFERMGLREVIDENIGARKHSETMKYTDSSYIESLVTMQIVGGETVDGIKLIREDNVISGILGDIPGKTSIHNYLNNFVDEQEEEKRGQGKAFVPESNDYLKGFDAVTKHLLRHAPYTKGVTTITLDQDDTFIPTGVTGALYNYKSERSFEAFITYCPEYDMIIRSEYRDGNVPPGYRQLENLQASLDLLPDSVEQVRLRSDTAGYQIDLLKYCAEGKNEKFGVIEFAISSPVTKELKQAVKVVSEDEWKAIPDTKQECADVVFVPNSLCKSKKDPDYRFIAIREEIGDAASVELRQLLLDLEIVGDHPITSVHPTMMDGKLYKVFALVTNLDWEAEEIVKWQRKRCGKSEEANLIMKEELAGGHVVTNALGANAAWWQITVLSFNIIALIKKICLPEEHQRSRPKKLRCWLFSVVARLCSHARNLTITIYQSVQARLFMEAWNKLEILMEQVE